MKCSDKLGSRKSITPQDMAPGQHPAIHECFLSFFYFSCTKQDNLVEPFHGNITSLHSSFLYLTNKISMTSIFHYPGKVFYRYINTVVMNRE